MQRQIAAGIKVYPDRPRRIEKFDWGEEDEDKRDNSKTAILIADLLSKKIGPVEKAFSDYMKSSSQAKVIQLMNEIDVTGNGKVEYSEFRNWVHHCYPALCRWRNKTPECFPVCLPFHVSPAISSATASRTTHSPWRSKEPWKIQGIARRTSATAT